MKRRSDKKEDALEEEAPEFMDEEEESDDENSPPSIDPYEVLGLEAEATADDVKKAYRKMALKHHPGMSRALFHLPLLMPPRQGC
jgi:DnaJ family protein C protein 9